MLYVYIHVLFANTYSMAYSVLSIVGKVSLNKSKR